MRISSASSSIWPRARSSSCSPVFENSRAKLSPPIPTPRVRRPPLSQSNVAVSRATLTGRRRGSGVTMGPSRTRSVAVGIAASVIHESATWRTGASQRSWSHTKTPCQPAASASAARRTTANGSESSSNSGSQRPERTTGPGCVVPASTLNAPVPARSSPAGSSGWRARDRSGDASVTSWSTGLCGSSSILEVWYIFRFKSRNCQVRWHERRTIRRAGCRFGRSGSWRW